MSGNTQVTHQWLLFRLSPRGAANPTREIICDAERHCALRYCVITTWLTLQVWWGNGRGGARLDISKLRGREGYRLRIGGSELLFSDISIIIEL